MLMPTRSRGRRHFHQLKESFQLEGRNLTSRQHFGKSSVTIPIQSNLYWLVCLDSDALCDLLHPTCISGWFTIPNHLRWSTVQSGSCWLVPLIGDNPSIGKVIPGRLPLTSTMVTYIPAAIPVIPKVFDIRACTKLSDYRDPGSVLSAQKISGYSLLVDQETFRWWKRATAIGKHIWNFSKMQPLMTWLKQQHSAC